MKFFTPKLYLLLNSSDRRVVEKAYVAWESAIDEYRKHLKTIDSRLSTNTRRLANSLCLHDAQFVALDVSYVASNMRVARVQVRQDASLVTLLYALVDDPVLRPVREKWTFEKDNPRWLYDEFDVDSRDSQTHDVLLSDGRTLSLKFRDIGIASIELPGRAEVA